MTPPLDAEEAGAGGSLGTHWLEADVVPRRHFTGDFREDRDAFDFALGLAVALSGSVHVRCAVGDDGCGGSQGWRGLGWANPDGTIRWHGEGSPPLASALREFRWPGEGAPPPASPREGERDDISSVGSDEKASTRGEALRGTVGAKDAGGESSATPHGSSGEGTQDRLEGSGRRGTEAAMPPDSLAPAPATPPREGDPSALLDLLARKAVEVAAQAVTAMARVSEAGVESQFFIAAEDGEEAVRRIKKAIGGAWREWHAPATPGASEGEREAFEKYWHGHPLAARSRDREPVNDSDAEWIFGGGYRAALARASAATAGGERAAREWRLAFGLMLDRYGPSTFDARDLERIEAIRSASIIEDRHGDGSVTWRLAAPSPPAGDDRRS